MFTLFMWLIGMIATAFLVKRHPDFSLLQEQDGPGEIALSIALCMAWFITLPCWMIYRLLKLVEPRQS